MHSISDAIAPRPFVVCPSWRGRRGRDPALVTQELRDRLFRDLTAILSGMHLWSADFFRPGQGGAAGELVPESAINASLGLCLKQLGWVVEREASAGQEGNKANSAHPQGSMPPAQRPIAGAGRDGYRGAPGAAPATREFTTETRRAQRLHGAVNWG
jgi:hypothetical protein